MRISGGEWCGRKLKVPGGDKVRPTQDRVRGAVFSMLMNELPGVMLLDLYAGSGSFGLDALSRGAGAVTWVEADKYVLSILKENVQTLAQNCRTEICQGDALRWVQTAGRGREYDMVFADPPYIRAEEFGFTPLMQALADGNCLKTGGLFIGEMSTRARVEDIPGWNLLREREYGHTRIAIWQRINPISGGGDCPDV